MSRVRADDYGDKRQGILDTAAALFAEMGYANVKMMDVAERCGASKSMLYHYFPAKEDVLYEIIRALSESHLAMAEEIVSKAAPAERRLHEFVTTWVRGTTSTRARHFVLMYEMKFLPKRQQKALGDIERRLIERITDLVGEVNPALRPPGTEPDKTYALLLFGMLNGAETWFKTSGPLGPDEMADRIFKLFLRGISAFK
ncbi:MAG: TetR/AcrR family transcriptional regulator [Anaeromyxobacteraceae bacterium]